LIDHVSPSAPTIQAIPAPLLDMRLSIKPVKAAACRISLSGATPF
jgi:hypothetical protein